MPISERRGRIGSGVLAVLTGAGTAGIAYLQPPHDGDAPRWVIYIACSAFVMSGLSLIVSESAHPRVHAWLAAGFLGAMVVPGAWIALGSGPRSCSVSLPFAGDAWADTLCRGVFGFGALIVAAFLAWFMTYAWRTKRRGS